MLHEHDVSIVLLFLFFCVVFCLMFFFVGGGGGLVVGVGGCRPPHNSNSKSLNMTMTHGT